MSFAATSENRLGAYLKDRRTRLDPTAFRGSPRQGAERRACVAKRGGAAAPTSVPPGTHGWSRDVGGAPSSDVPRAYRRGANADRFVETRTCLPARPSDMPPKARYRNDKGRDGRALPARARCTGADTGAPYASATWDVHRVEPRRRSDCWSITARLPPGTAQHPAHPVSRSAGPRRPI